MGGFVPVTLGCSTESRRAAIRKLPASVTMIRRERSSRNLLAAHSTGSLFPYLVPVSRARARVPQGWESWHRMRAARSGSRNRRL
jgi:hypothetical protein